jgi:hypothetical protein
MAMAGRTSRIGGANRPENEQQQGSFIADCERIHREWHERAKVLDTEGLFGLYAKDALLESPLVPAILDDKRDGVLRGHDELRRSFAQGARRRPNALVCWYRTGEWLTGGRRFLVWEYPRQAPDGDQQPRRRTALSCSKESSCVGNGGQRP